jgi:hypothetical protein
MRYGQICYYMYSYLESEGARFGKTPRLVACSASDFIKAHRAKGCPLATETNEDDPLGL